MLSESRPREMQNREFRKKIICSKVSTSPCGKLYRRSIFQSGSLDIPRQIIYGEDMIMNIRLAFQTEKPVRFIGKVVYYYIRNANSASHSFKKTADYEELFAEILRLSIPEPFRRDKDYIFARIACKINGWRGMNFLRMSTDENRETEFYRNLIAEIKETNYPIGWQNRIHVFGKSMPLRAIAIALNLMPIVKYKIIYKLKQICELSCKIIKQTESR